MLEAVSRSIKYLVACAATLLLSTAGSSCGDSGPSEEEKADAQRIWDTAHEQMHAMHIEHILMAEGPVPMTATYQCPDGGTIDMTVTFDGGDVRKDITDLRHVLKNCQSRGLTLDGTLDYLDFELCDNDVPTLSVSGNIVVTGELENECEFTGLETCGDLGGKACGVRVE